jgi:hypothetical protein
MYRFAKRYSIVPLAFLAAACSNTITSNPPNNLERPSDIVFACHGDYRLYGDDGMATEGDELVRSAQPLVSCSTRSTGETPDGQQQLGDEPELQPPNFHGFALQTGTGTLSLITFPSNSMSPIAVDDADLLTPGKNAIPVGTLPIALTADPQGCHVVTANKGSCDLSVLDINSAIDRTTQAIVTRVSITNSAGDEVLAEPRAMVTEPSSSGVMGDACPASPDGLVYVAYPDCHMVAVVHSGTGEVRAGIRFNDDGTTEIVDGSFTCPDQCGGGPIVASDAERPTALFASTEGERLYIGAENSNTVTIVELDADHLPLSIARLPLEGDVGVVRIAVSDLLNMGGSLGMLGGSAGEFRFVYAITSDGTIRVADVHNLMSECDTQVDPRYSHDIKDVSLLSCFPVGDVATPPRRFGAISPGIHVPRDSVPLDVAFTTVSEDDLPIDSTGAVGPETLIGHFAFVTSSDGLVVAINVDDDNYPDFEDDDDPIAVYMPLAQAHQIRDFVINRDSVSVNPETGRDCTYPDMFPATFGPRLTSSPARSPISSVVGPSHFHLLPRMREHECTSLDSEGEEFSNNVHELSFMAPDAVRESAFPDLYALANDEDWSMTYEGPLSEDSSNEAIDGPPVRLGVIESSGIVRLDDFASPFCKMGVEPYDIIELLGCDPEIGDANCGVGETCYVHPDSALPLGMCLPAGREDQLAASCANVLTSRRVYTVTDTNSDSLTLNERRRVLRTTPIAGCVDDSQCDDMYQVEAALEQNEHPKDAVVDTSFSWQCGADPTRAPGVDKCMMTCGTESDCEDGFKCSSGFCIEGPLPPQQCVEALQRYRVRAGEAFSVIGSRQGFLHNRIIDENTGECIDDPDGHPLNVGRIPLTAPPCTADGLTDLLPNPCSVTVSQADDVLVYANVDTCEIQYTDLQEMIPDTELVVRDVEAIRFRNPSFTMNMAHIQTTGDARCVQDGEGAHPAFSPVFRGYRNSFSIVGGHLPLFVALGATLPVRVVEGPGRGQTEKGMWVMDAGDSNPLGGGGHLFHGHVFRFRPAIIANPVTSLD